jgi:hypothetical protein
MQEWIGVLRDQYRAGCEVAVVGIWTFKILLAIDGEIALRPELHPGRALLNHLNCRAQQKLGTRTRHPGNSHRPR